MMDLGQLRSFAEVAELGTVAAAAKARGYTAPAVSQHIAKLEAELDTKLFDRVGRRLRLTPAGTALVPVALKMIDLETQGRTVVDGANKKPKVVLAGLASALSAVVIPRLRLLAAQVAMEIHEREDAEALTDLSLGRADIVLTQEYDDQPVESNDRFVLTPLIRDPLRIALPPTMHPSTTLDQLRETPWLINGHKTLCAEATTTILRRAGISPSVSGSITDNQTLLGLVAAGHGVTIVPQLLTTTSHHKIMLAHQDLRISRTIHAVSRKAEAPGVAAVLKVLICEPA